MAWAPGTRRETLLTLGVSPAMHIGVEIGAANNPIIPAHIGTCRYVDYMTTEQLRERLADYPYRDSLVAIDYVWSGSGSLVDRIGADRFDYAIASHVIEHVPNPVGWFSGIYGALKPDGHSTWQSPTDASRLICAHLRAAWENLLKLPSPSAALGIASSRTVLFSTRNTLV